MVDRVFVFCELCRCKTDWWDCIVSTNSVGLSESGCVACVQEVICGRWTRLLRGDREIGVDCSLAT